MGKYKSLMLLAVAVVIALMTSLMILGYIQKKGKVKEVALEIHPVVVAALDLSWGTRITNEMLKKANFLKGSLTAGYFSDPNLVVGRVLIYPVKANEPIFESRLAPAEIKSGGIAAVITPKKRAVAVKVDKVIGVSGFLRPGNRVDVLMTIGTGRTFNPTTKIILENILVLAVGSDTTEKKSLEEKLLPAEVVTLEVTPEEAERLALAATEGRLQLALRNFSDTENIVTHGTTVSSLVGSHSPTAPREPRPPVRKEVEVKQVLPEPAVPPGPSLPDPPARSPASPPVPSLFSPPPPPVEKKVEIRKPPVHTVELIKGSKVSEVKFEGSE
ncbi:MAG: Flp pilus assembly protein CpaB [Thermodesulfobacteriota bacterium]